MELLMHPHQHHLNQQLFFHYDTGGSEISMDQSEIIYKNFRKNMEFDIFFEKLKRNRYEHQKLKQKKAVEKISLNIYLDEFNDYELNERTTKEVDDFEHFYLNRQQQRNAFRKAQSSTELAMPTSQHVIQDIAKNKVIPTTEDSLFKTITLDISLEENKFNVNEINQTGPREDALYKKMTISKKKEKLTKKAQMVTNVTVPAAPYPQQMYSNIIFYSQADEEIVSNYSFDLNASANGTISSFNSNGNAPPQPIPFYTFNLCEDFDFNSYFMSSLKICNFETKKRKQRIKNDKNLKSQSICSHSESRTSTDSQSNIVYEESMAS